MTPGGGVTVEREGPWLRVAIVGRVTGEAIAAFEAALERAVARPEPYVVLFDRRAMTGPTKEGREALDRWGESIMPRVAATCAGWADVYDERRAAAFRNAAVATEGTDQEADREGEDEAPGPAYPHQLFDDHAAATAWLADLLAQRTAPARPTAH